MRIPYPWKLVIILWFAFFFNQADRQIFNVVLSDIRDDLGFTDAQMGLVSTSFLLVYGLLVPVAGVVGDWFSKKRVIVVALLIWTTGTLLTGFSMTIAHFIILRCIAMGGGEAFYSPSANSLIAESHKKTLSTALSVHQTALYFGVIISSYITGYIAELYGWRVPFFVFGSGGLILTIVIYLQVRDSKPVHLQTEDKVLPAGQQEVSSAGSDNQKPTGFRGVGEVVSIFFRTPTAVLLAFAFAGMQFVGMGFLAWMPTFLHEKYDMSLSQAGFDATFYYKAAAFVAIVVSARTTDWLASRFSAARGMTQAVGLLIGAPAIYFIGASSSVHLVYVAMVFYGICQGLYDSNIFASLYEVIELRYRATATGIMLSFGFVIGAFAPFLLGLIKPMIGLSEGLSILSIGLVFAAICILVAMKFFFKKDRIELEAV